MKIFATAALLAGCAIGSVAAFAPFQSSAARSSARFYTDTPLVDVPVASAAAKKNLLEVATRLKNEYGILLLEKSAKEDFKEAVEQLENLSEPPSMDADYQDLFRGDWTLLCTTSTNNDGVDTSRLPAFLNQDPLKKIRDSIREAANKYLVLQQSILSSKPDEEGEEGSVGVIDRIDNTLEYKPPEQLRELLDSLPEQLSNLNINPLHVSKSKLVLKHKATIDESSAAALVTKTSLQSIVLNVAGTSTVLDPDGTDLINLPLGDFINTGSFETTYLDDTLRISRGKQGFVDQLRVFVRSETLVEPPTGDEEVVAGTMPVDAEVVDEVPPTTNTLEDGWEPKEEDDDDEDAEIEI